MKGAHHGSLSNIFTLGIKEFRSLLHDKAMLFLILFMFTAMVYADAKAKPESLNRATVAVVDEDQSQLSSRIITALHPPQFTVPELITLREMDKDMDSGRHTFVLDIPPDFERDVMAGRGPDLQLNVDATRLSQAQTGTSYLQNIVDGEIRAYVQRHRASAATPVELNVRVFFNPNVSEFWFAAINSIVNNITLLGILLTGAALIRENEHGTIEHLLVMPVTPLEIMLSKVWSMGLVVLVVSSVSLHVMVQGVLGVTINGSTLLFACCTLLYLFAAASIGIYMATLTRTMPQFGLLAILVLLPLEILSGGATPRESMPETIQWIMSLAPTTHYVSLAQAILFRGAGFSIIWPSFLAMAAIGAFFFWFAHRRLRRMISSLR
ncbi:ABC transporter permease [Pseudodesulfovibrio thermohalotolerans]|uniref:ABC transporter permease n=1 Tax=Pseudodesulfovibrio thermohalotolerans TaxID=2880651 RepID=UPI002443722D|nr:ABC transporter permease [Pseudodesulfovibrio thermohalotolerans]WFS62332.1 ABC transporter permease [Pseudodesulfovibrio thermohalotolerans]